MRFEARALRDNAHVCHWAHVCHCRMCQRASGNFFAPLVAVPREALAWVRGVPAVFESSEAHERGFCRACGTPLFFRVRGAARTSLNIPAFDVPETIPLRYEFGMESRAPQLDQLGRVEHDRTAEIVADADRIVETSRQYRP